MRLRGVRVHTKIAKKRIQQAMLDRIAIKKGGTVLYRNEKWFREQWIDRDLTLKQISKLCGASMTTLEVWKKRLNIKKERDCRYKDYGWFYQKYVLEKLSIPAMAKLCNVPARTVWHWLGKHGIQARKASEYHVGKKRSKKTGIKISKALTQYIQKKCKVCDNAFVVPSKKKRQATCGDEGCQAKLGKGKYNGRYKKLEGYCYNEIGEILLECENCHKIFPVLPALVRKRNVRHCSLPCANETQIKKLKEKDYLSQHLAKSLASLAKRPNNPEKAFNELTPDMIRYVGNRAWWRFLPNGKWKNPDFKVTGQDKVIEVFGAKGYFHTEKEATELIDLYKQVGIDCLVVWDYEIYKQPDQVVSQVIAFLGE